MKFIATDNTLGKDYDEQELKYLKQHIEIVYDFVRDHLMNEYQEVQVILPSQDEKEVFCQIYGGFKNIHDKRLHCNLNIDLTKTSWIHSDMIDVGSVKTEIETLFKQYSIHTNIVVFRYNKNELLDNPDFYEI